MRAATLTLLTLLSLVAGVFYGHYVLFDPSNPLDRDHWTSVAGDLVLLRPLSLLVLPLAFVAAATATAALRTLPRLGLVFAAIAVYFAITTLVAALIGVVSASTFTPGDLPEEVRTRLIADAEENLRAASSVNVAAQSFLDEGRDDLPAACIEIIRRALPGNLVHDMADGRMLGLITLAILLGVGMMLSGAAPLLSVLTAARAALIKVTHLVSWIAPAGVFMLAAYAVGSVGLVTASETFARYGLVVLGALAIHAAIVLPLGLVIVRCNPFAYASRVAPALLAAAATASSVAAVPLSLASATALVPAQRRGRWSGPCAHAAAGVVIPLGSMMNFNGTAVFQSAAVVFLCQVHAINLTMIEMVVIVVATFISAISTAGIPGGGLATLVIVISAVNTSLAGRGSETLPISAIGMLVAVDRLLDMCRTAVNVWGDLVGARMISLIAPDDAESMEGQPAAGREQPSQNQNH